MYRVVSGRSLALRIRLESLAGSTHRDGDRAAALEKYDKGVLSVRDGADIGVNIRFEFADHPLHGYLSPAGNLAELGVPEREGGVLFQPPVVRAVVALHRGDD